jgi:Family of unknown function (DUF6131)
LAEVARDGTQSAAQSIVVGLLLALLGRMGHAVGGRRHYY